MIRPDLERVLVYHSDKTTAQTDRPTGHPFFAGGQPPTAPTGSVLGDREKTELRHGRFREAASGI